MGQLDGVLSITNQPEKNLTMPAKSICALILTMLATPLFAVGPGDTAPSWTGTDFATQSTIDFPEVLDGKPAVLVFWATWCPYCKAFMPYVKAIEADYRDQGVQVITFNTKERGRGDPAAYVASLDFPFIAIEAADEIGDSYDIPFIPGLLVVDGAGEVAVSYTHLTLPTKA